MPFKKLPSHKMTSRTLLLLILAAFIGVLAVSTFEPLAFLNLPGLLVIILGTAGATVLSHSFSDCIEAIKQSLNVKESEHHNVANDANIILHFAQLWFRNQYIQIDRDLSKLEKPFLKKGLQMIRDRQPSDDILALLNWQISQVNQIEGKYIGVFKSMAGFAPAFGVLGTIIAMINVVYLLEQGAAISEAASLLGFALVSTCYGLMIANLVFKPIATRLEKRRINEVQYITLLAEGIVLIHQKSTPAVIRETLMTYIESMEPKSDSDAPNMQKTSQKKTKKPMLVKFGFQRSSS